MNKGCLAKTHFTHSLKLRSDGGRTLFNDGKSAIELQKDTEGSEDVMIRDFGVIASIYRSDLWKDKEAMQALMNADNDDADVELAEDEIQAQGRVESAISALKVAGVDRTRESALASMKQSGLRSWSEAHTINFIDFRLSMLPSVAQCFRHLIFLSVNGRVAVNPGDYQAAATLDVRCQWTRPQTPGSRTTPGALRVASLRPRYDSLGMPTCCMGTLIQSFAS